MNKCIPECTAPGVYEKSWCKKCKPSLWSAETHVKLAQVETSERSQPVRETLQDSWRLRLIRSLDLINIYHHRYHHHLITDEQTTWRSRVTVWSWSDGLPGRRQFWWAAGRHWVNEGWWSAWASPPPRQICTTWLSAARCGAAEAKRRGYSTHYTQMHLSLTFHWRCLTWVHQGGLNVTSAFVEWLVKPLLPSAARCQNKLENKPFNSS